MNKTRKHPKTAPVPPVKIGRVIGTGINKRVIDPDTVYKLAKINASYVEIASIIGLHVDTLRYNFQDVLDLGYADVRVALRKKQIEVALEGEGNVPMLIWLGKSMLNQTDKQTMDIVTPDYSKLLPTVVHKVEVPAVIEVEGESDGATE